MNEQISKIIEFKTKEMQDHEKWGNKKFSECTDEDFLRLIIETQRAIPMFGRPSFKFIHCIYSLLLVCAIAAFILFFPF